MALRQKLIFSWPVGTTPITLLDWANTLPEADRNEFLEAREAQYSHRAQVIADGKMNMDANKGYDWENKEAQLEYKNSYNDTWFKYWERYLKETGTIFTEEDEEIE